MSIFSLLKLEFCIICIHFKSLAVHVAHCFPIGNGLFSPEESKKIIQTEEINANRGVQNHRHCQVCFVVIKGAAGWVSSVLYCMVLCIVIVLFGSVDCLCNTMYYVIIRNRLHMLSFTLLMCMIHHFV